MPNFTTAMTCYNVVYAWPFQQQPSFLFYVMQHKVSVYCLLHSMWSICHVSSQQCESFMWLLLLRILIIKIGYRRNSFWMILSCQWKMVLKKTPSGYCCVCYVLIGILCSRCHVLFMPLCQFVVCSTATTPVFDLLVPWQAMSSQHYSCPKTANLLPQHMPMQKVTMSNSALSSGIMRPCLSIVVKRNLSHTTTSFYKWMELLSCW